MHDEFDEGSWTAGFRSKRTWIRGFFMLVFLFILWFARLLLIVMTVFQFGALLIIRRPVARGLPLGRGLARYLEQIAMFLTCNTEDKPFPFAPWPDTGVSDTDEEGEEDYGEEAEPWEVGEPYEPPDAPFAPEPEAPEPPVAAEPEPEPEPEPEAEEKPKAKPRAARKKKKSTKAADTAETEDTAEPDDATDPDEEEPDKTAPPRPDA